MIGLLVISHASLGNELVGAAEFILGKIEKARSLSVEAGQDPDQIIKDLRRAVDDLKNPDGVLILTDMFGGTPNNISLPFLEPGLVEVVTGVNLPMIIKAATSRKDATVSELASQVCQAGRDAISSAVELLAS